MEQIRDMPLTRLSDSEYWLGTIFLAKAASGGVVRRSISWVDREIGRQRFLDEVRGRGFHLLMTRDQFIIVCNRDPVQMLF